MISQKEIIQWLQEYKGILNGCPLEKEKIPEFVRKLENKIGQMDWSQVEGKSVIAYSGGMGVTNEMGEPVWAWKVVEKIIPTDPELAAKSQGTFLRVTEPGTLYNDDDNFGDILKDILEEDAYTKVFDGRDPSTGERLPAGYSEYNGEKVQSLADYFSAQLMKQAKNTTYIFQIYLSAKAI